jgi:putative oxidoreductase
LFSVFVSFLIRITLVALFLPFSALDKVLNTQAAVEQAAGGTRPAWLSRGLVGAGLFVEVVMSLAVVTGFFDRLAAVILAGYCAVTALLWKQFWKTPDFRLKGPSKGRDVFWDFLKNFALAGGFLVLATGGTAYGVTHLVLHPFSSTHPYSATALDLHAPDASATNPPTGVSR